jgi:hypothetical protein
MTDAATLESWLNGLGLEVKEGSDSGVLVQRSDAGTWDLVHERSVPQAVLSTDWHAPWDTDPPDVVVGNAAREVAYGFPLVESDTHHAGGDLSVRFRAPIFEEGLTRQGFALTASAVLKAAQTFDVVLARRADELAAWKEFEANSEQRKQKEQELIDRMAEPATTPEASAPVAPVSATSSSDDTEPAVAWTPTHEVKRRTDAWGQPDPAGARAGTLKRRVPVQVTERHGDWARVVTSNGWSGWIDSRDLKAR